MPPSPEDLEQRLLALYADQGTWTRFHVRGRLKSCPFHALLDHLPENGVIASLGCGHGAFELLAALRHPGCRILGADLAADKIEVARAAAARAPDLNVSFHDADLFEVLEREGVRPDVVIVFDVLCLIPKSEHVAIARSSFDVLADSGRLLVKEMGTRPRWKRAWNAFQETLACRVFRFTYAPGPYLNFLTEREWSEELTRIGFEPVTLHPMDSGYLHPHLLVRAEKQPGGRS